MNLKLLKDFGCQYGVDPRILYAILLNESNARGFSSPGKVIERFESGIYANFIRVKKGLIPKHPSLPGLDPAWIRKHDTHQLMLMSTSYGIGQIMGWHYPYIGYKTVEEMISDYAESEDNQIESFLIFCLNYRDGRFLKALRALDYRLIANMYNGANYSQNNYDVKLKNHFTNEGKIFLS